MLRDASGVDRDRLRELQQLARQNDQPVVELLADREAVDEPAMLASLGQAVGLDVWDRSAGTVSANLVDDLPASLAARYHVFPVGRADDELLLATHDPLGWSRWDELTQLLGRPARRVLAPRPVIADLIKTHYGVGADTVERLTHGRAATPHPSDDPSDLADTAAGDEPTVVHFVNQILAEAIAAQATDIHFEPSDRRYRVRYRIDGLLEDVSVPVRVGQLKAAIVSRLKIMSHLDITEKRLPQDGRARVHVGAKPFDLRVSVLPGVHGEAVNIRIQSRQMVELQLTGLGFDDQQQKQIARLAEQSHGLVLVTGPTGSGKTTTLYTCLRQINRPETKIITIEDPVEYWMDDILQMQVHEEIGFDFARALRSMLRHDPDVMLIGEIRDRPTADITIRSALTGHLVFATLHTNDAAGAVSRLLDIGVEPFLAASSVTGIIAQRLVRKVCESCREPAADARLPGVESSWVGRGCGRCRHTGYRGRSVIAEVLPISAEIRGLIQGRASADQIQQAAARQGMTSLRDSALQAVRDGRTTVAEALRVTQEVSS